MGASQASSDTHELCRVEAAEELAWVEHVAELGRVEHARELALEQTAEPGRTEQSGPKLCLRLSVPDDFMVGAALLGLIDMSLASAPSPGAVPGREELAEDDGQIVESPPQLCRLFDAWLEECSEELASLRKWAG